jgi:DnaJ-class molecular chaperone
MNNKTQINIQTLRDQLAVAKVNLKQDKAALKELGRKCSGTGEFSKNGKKIGVCYPCKGTGWHVERGFVNRCQTCHGLMLVKGKYIDCYTCTKCKGVGELPMWNPVLPRGLLMGNGG